MLEWLSTYGLDILLGILSSGGLYAGISGIVRTIKLNNKIDKTVDEKIGKVQEDVVITQEAVIQAFKQAILGNDFKKFSPFFVFSNFSASVKFVTILFDGLVSIWST